jgi:outer membrane receptor for ferrienterochelin and colicins
VRRAVLVSLASCAAVAVSLAGVGHSSGDDGAAAHEESTEDEPRGEEVIIVTGTRSETPLGSSPVVTEVIDRERIEESGATSVADALAMRPGIWIDRGLGGAGVTIQGLGAEYVLVLVDGQRQIGRVDGKVDLDRLATGDVERIEVVRGPGSALYGSEALGGVINVITRAPEDGVTAEAAGRIDGRLGTDLRGALGLGRGAWRGGVDGEWRRGDPYDRDPSDPATTIAGYDDARAGARGAWRGGDRVRVDVAADYQRRDLRAVDAPGSGAVLDRRNLIELAAARATTRWSSERTIVAGGVALGLYRDQFAVDQRGASALDQYQETREDLVETTLQVEHVLGRHQLTAGAEALRESLSSDRLSTPGERGRGAIYLQDTWRIGAEYRWLVVPAIRLDHDTQFGAHATPRLAARWDPTDQIVLRASAGTGYRAPSFKELLLRFENPGAGYVVEGNPALAPETSRSLQLGGEWRPRRRAWLAANAFHNELRDLITAVTIDDGGGMGPLRFGYANIGRARTQGVEIAAVVGRGRASLEAGWAYTRARDRDAGRALEGVPAQRAALAARWRDPAGVELFAEAALTGPRPYYVSEDPAAATWSEPRVDLRARAARRFGEHLAFFVGGENLLDAGDDTFDPIAPRTLYVGVEARR